MFKKREVFCITDWDTTFKREVYLIVMSLYDNKKKSIRLLQLNYLDREGCFVQYSYISLKLNLKKITTFPLKFL